MTGAVIGERPRRFSENANTPDDGWNAGAFHQAAVNGVVWVLHQRIQVTSSGSPRSCGTAEPTCPMSGQVYAHVSITRAAAATTTRWIIADCRLEIEDSRIVD